MARFLQFCLFSHSTEYYLGYIALVLDKSSTPFIIFPSLKNLVHYYLHSVMQCNPEKSINLKIQSKWNSILPEFKIHTQAQKQGLPPLSKLVSD